MTDTLAVTFADIQAAAARLAGQAVRTPLIESPALNERLGGRILIKPETLQRAGAFKFRGAYNRLSQLSDDERRRGVVAFSSGNHAQGVALAAQLLGCPALIVMPSDSPAVKVEGTRGFGAEIRFYDRFTEDRIAIADQIATERGCVVVPSYDDPHIIAGQGTAGLEIVEQARALGVALLTPIPGELTWPINSRNLSGVVAVTDAEVAEAMRYAFSVLKLVIEPGGCVALTAALTGKIDLKGTSAAIVCSGGNVDPALYARVLAGEI
jgi:threonine dehydratase